MHALETDNVLAARRDGPTRVARRSARRRRPYGRRLSRPVPLARRRRGGAGRRRAGGAAASWTRSNRRRRSRPCPGSLLPRSDGERSGRPASTGQLAPRRRAVPVTAIRRPLATAVRLSGAPAGVARGNRARLSLSLLVLLDLAAARSRGRGTVDRCSVADDFAAVGDDVFVADDLFWYHPSRSLELARRAQRRGIRKKWILVQSRVDLVARHPELLEAWRPSAREFDIFFGLEAATNEGLKGLVKDATVDHTAAGDRAIARRSGYGVTGNFVIDPAWRASDFERLWAIRRTLRALPSRLHDSDPAARHARTSKQCGRASRAAMVALRHAPSAVGTRARRGAVLRAVLRNLAALGAQPARPQVAVAVDARGRSVELRCSCCRRCVARSA